MGNTIKASDGSLKDKHFSAGWIMKIHTQYLDVDEVQQGGTPLDSSPYEASSTHRELGGILGLLTANSA